MIATIFTLFFLILQASAEDDLCHYFKYCGNASQSSTSKSLPSSASSANFNPSTISNFKGLGVETLYQPNNPLGFNLITGTGKVGGALITPTAENSFFGNRSIEIDEIYQQRRIDNKRYISKKINVALGAKIISKKNYAFDLGVSLKRNPEVKKINPGVGFSARIAKLNFGAHFYTDDTKIELGNYLNPYTLLPYSAMYNDTTYTESFNVKTFSVGTKFGKLALDYGYINTKYNFYANDTTIMIYSAAYNHNKFLFNAAYRREYSDNAKEEKGIMTLERNKFGYYAGLQYFWNRHLVTGVAFNHFLLNELSFTLTLFL